MSRMSTLARESSKTFTHGAIEPLDQGGSELLASQSPFRQGRPPARYIAALFPVPPSKPRMHLSMHVAFQPQQDDSVREPDTLCRCGRPYWISIWQVRQRTSVFRWRAAMI